MGIGLVGGLRGRGDGAAFKPLVRQLKISQSLLHDAVPNPDDYALVQVIAKLTGGLSDAQILSEVRLIAVGSAQDLDGGQLLPTKLCEPGSQEEICTLHGYVLKQLDEQGSFFTLGSPVLGLGSQEPTNTLPCVLASDTCIEERNGSDVTFKQMIWGTNYIDELVQVRLATGEVHVLPDPLYDLDSHWICQDANYNVLGLVNASGALVERYEYSPYGQRKVFASAGTNDPGNYAPTLASQRASSTAAWAKNEFGHQGLMHDEEIDLVYNRARMLHPGLGRFVQRDRLEYRDGLYLYSYAGLHPTRSMDPMGLSWQKSVLCAGCVADILINLTAAAVECSQTGQYTLDDYYHGSRSLCVIMKFWEKESEKNPISKAATVAACYCCGKIVAEVMGSGASAGEHGEKDVRDMTHNEECEALLLAWHAAIGSNQFELAQKIKEIREALGCDDGFDDATADDPPPSVPHPEEEPAHANCGSCKTRS
jgi:RHS repeat-associated protein